MINKVLALGIFILLSCVTAYGQTSYKGLTPGKSTRADVERVLGQPVNKVSETLIEYAPLREFVTGAARAGGEVQMYVQYRPGSPLVERIAIVLKGPDVFELQYGQTFDGSNLSWLDAQIIVNKAGRPWLMRYYGDPFFAVWSIPQFPQPEGQIRVEYYSPELYSNAVPKGGCNGTFIGDWNTDLGRMTIRLAPDQGGTYRYQEVNKKMERRVNGTYSNNNGVFSGVADYSGSLKGDWKDDTGAGELDLSLEKLKLHHDNLALKGIVYGKVIQGNPLILRGQCVESNTGRTP